jgi:poly-gamma-glutamate synthesis protein (capsule biosynthesis protein)
VAPEITLAFAGDVHFTGRTRPLLDDPATAVGPFAKALRAADFAMVNLETAVTGRGTPQPKTFHFRAPPTAYRAVKAAGIDLVSLANNHTLDYGQVGLADTLAAAKTEGMAVVGAGRNAAAAYAPHLTTVRGTRLAVLAFSQIHTLAAEWRATDTRPGMAMAFDTTRALAAVKAAHRAADVVIVFMHWGLEGSPCPTAEMETFATKLAKAGADLIIGAHAHILLGDGWLGDTYVHYGLGNFVWYSISHSTETGVLEVTLRRNRVTGSKFLPGVVSTTGQPKPVTSTNRAKVERAVARAARCSGLADSR